MRLSQRLALIYIRTKFKLLSRLSKRNAAKKAFELFCTPKERTDGPLPPIFDRSDKLSFPLEGATVHGYRWNHPSTKKLLILHGFESSVINFDNYIEPLIAKGYEVLAFDAPAHGRSTGQSIDVLTYKNMVCRVTELYGPVCSFLAHSFGGLSLALALEDVPHDAGTRAVLIAPATETSTAIENFFTLLRLEPGVQSEFYRLIVESGGKGAEWFSVARAARNIHASVLFVQDKADGTTPIKDVAPIMAKHYPNFRFLITEGLGHSRIYRDPETVKKIIDFL